MLIKKSRSFSHLSGVERGGEATGKGWGVGVGECHCNGFVLGERFYLKTACAGSIIVMLSLLVLLETI